MRFIQFFIFIFLLVGFPRLSAGTVEGAKNCRIAYWNKALNQHFPLASVQHQDSAEGKLKSIDKNRAQAVINSENLAKNTAPSGKDRSTGLDFWYQALNFKRLVFYTFFESCSIDSKDFIAFKRMLLYPKHSFW